MSINKSLQLLFERCTPAEDLGNSLETVLDSYISILIYEGKGGADIESDLSCLKQLQKTLQGRNRDLVQLIKGE